MSDVTIYFRGSKSENRALPAVPAVGTYIIDGTRLWLVDTVAIGDVVNVYAIEVSAGLASELTAAWSAWCKADIATE
jgi:hypothetical protein